MLSKKKEVEIMQGNKNHAKKKLSDRQHNLTEIILLR